jgi:hypothetical protein
LLGEIAEDEFKTEIKSEFEKEIMSELNRRACKNVPLIQKKAQGRMGKEAFEVWNIIMCTKLFLLGA